MYRASYLNNIALLLAIGRAAFVKINPNKIEPNSVPKIICTCNINTASGHLEDGTLLPNPSVVCTSIENRILVPMSSIPYTQGSVSLRRNKIVYLF